MTAVSSNTLWKSIPEVFTWFSAYFDRYGRDFFNDSLLQVFLSVGVMFKTLILKVVPEKKNHTYSIQMSAPATLRLTSERPAAQGTFVE